MTVSTFDGKTSPGEKCVDGSTAKVEGTQPSMMQPQTTLKQVSEFRTFLPQVLASTAKNLILLDLGMTLAFPTLVIPALLKATSGLSFTEEQASWFGSIVFICQPAGSVVSGLMFEPLGRKRAMILVNIPHIIGWFLLYFAQSITELYVAAIIMGLGIGFMEAPILTYVGEISQPKWRGILTSYAGIFVTIGFTLVYFLGTLTEWQTAAAICSSVPMLAVLVISQVPESPIWLLSKGRVEEAEQALCWLRGWVSPAHVEQEFKELVQYKESMHASKKANLEQGTVNTVSATVLPPTLTPQRKSPVKKIIEILKLKDLFRRQTLQPLIMIVIFFLFNHAAGVTGTRPFMVEIFDEFGSPLDSHVVTVISSVIGIVGNIIGMVSVQRLGKRSLSLWSIAGCALSNFAIAVYGLGFMETSPYNWLPISFYITLNFIWSVGIGQIPWMLTSEVFPFRGRGLASGIAAGLSYCLAFIFAKTYFDLHSSFTIGGTFGFYGILMVIGWFLLYFFLPETEGKTLEEVETILEDKFNQIRNIQCKR